MSLLFKVVFLLGISLPVFADSLEQLPHEFTIEEFQCNKGCLELKNMNGKQLGTLVPSDTKTGTYILKDVKNQPQIMIQYISRMQLFQTHEILYYNVYDAQGHFLHRVSEETYPSSISGSLWKLSLYELDSDNIKATLIGNMSATSHSVYEGLYRGPLVSWGAKELATLSRPLFSMQRNSKVTVLDSEQLFSFCNPQLFAALSAFHCLNPEIKLDPIVRRLENRIESIVKKYPNMKKISTNSSQLSAIADKINARFDAQYQDVNLTIEEKVTNFVYFVCDLLDSHSLSLEEEKILVIYLKNLMKE